VDFTTDFQFKLSRRVGSKVPAFAHFHTILSRYSLCHNEREKEEEKREERERERERKGGGRGRERERERKRGRGTVER